MTDTDLAFASIEEIARLFRKRKLSPVELTKLILERIERLNSRLNAYITVTAEHAREQARHAERELLGPRGKRRDRGVLHGIPISLKDNIYTEGVRTTAGSAILKDFVPGRNAPVVNFLFGAGAVLLGKTNMHEFAYGVTSNNPHFGPVRNPWDLERIAGGSSGGSAAAVASGLCYGSIGTDTGGSVRIPAGLCGVVGLKPTIGRVPVDGVIPLSPRLDCVGPLARTAQDAAILLEPIFVRGKGGPSPKPSFGSSAKLRKIRLGLPREFFFDLISDDVRQVFEEAIRCLVRIGAETKEVSIPLLKETEDAGNQIAWAEATHYHQRAGWFPKRAQEYGEDVRILLEMGTKVTATTYLEALDLREKFIQQLHLAMEDASVDVLVVPTAPIAAPLIGEETTPVAGRDRSTRTLLLRLNRPANLAGVPAISLPCGFTKAGLPVGLQFIGRSQEERALLRIATVYEQAHPWHRRRPEL